MPCLILSSKMTLEEMRKTACDMAIYAAKLINGADPKEAATWRTALRRIGCQVIIWEGAGVNDVAQFMPALDDSEQYPLGLVRYNLGRERITRAKGLAHEFGHALLFQWVPIMLYDADIVYSYHDDSRSVRHQIARMFERLMVG